MATNIDWSKIDDGFHGFENLATTYVQEQYGDIWEPTKATRDGNKDAYTIILGYKPFKSSQDEWWMEAKYSQNTEYVTRYRLDATLVSAILKGNVSKIIFVTNIQINSKTISDIRQALASSIGCHDVDFCTQYTLEYWLYQNPEIYKVFFKNEDYLDFEQPNLVLIDPMEFFSSDLNCLVFKESLRVLELNHRYSVHLSIFSKKATTVSLKCASNLKGMKILSPRKISLQIGINYISFEFILNENYSYKSIKAQEEHDLLPIPAFKIGEVDIYSKYNIEVNSYCDKFYELTSQQNILKIVEKNYRDFTKKSFSKIMYLHGLSGVGKTSILTTFLQKNRNDSTLFFFAEIAEDMSSNIAIIVRCIYFIYFPYLPPEEITIEYIRKINETNYIPELLLEIVEKVDNQELCALFEKYVNEDILLFPIKLNINKRVIIIDNIRKTNTLIYGVLCKMAIEMKKREIPFLLIFSGQEIIRNNSYTLLKRHCPIIEKELTISFCDCINVLEENGIDTSVFKSVNLKPLFANTIEMLYFVRYIIENKPILTDFLSISTVCHLFFKEEITEAYILKNFADVFKNSELLEMICNDIYWKNGGLEFSDTPEIRKLLGNHLIRIEPNTNRLIPYHDIYTKYFRKNYPYKAEISIENTTLENFYNNNFSEAKKIINILKKLLDKKEFNIVYYTLDPIFQGGESSQYKNYFNLYDYYQLFSIYAEVCTHSSFEYSGRNIYKTIYLQTKNLHSQPKQLIKICNKALWELTNSTFEWLEYETSAKYLEELKAQITEMVKLKLVKGSPQNSVRYHNAEVIRCLIASEMEKNNSETIYKNVSKSILDNKFYNRFWSFEIRYSLTLMQHSPELAMEKLIYCNRQVRKKNFWDEKYYLWSGFYYSYLNMIINENHRSIINALDFMQRLHDKYFNDYRKCLYGMATYYYYKKEVEKGDELLLSDSFVMREMRPRLKGFYHLTIALHDVMTNNYTDALKSLRYAQKIFARIPSYYKLITHNINLLENSDAPSFKIKYYTNEKMQDDIYYLDLRCCW